MGVTYVKEVMSPEELLEAYPLPAEHKKLKEARDAEIKKVFTGESDKFLVIIGPCSADNEDSVCDYINRLAKVQDKVSDKILIIPRIYTNKPRTTGQGYKGIVHQPDPEKEPDLHDGLIAMRKMHLRAIAETHLFAADEMLYPENWPYISDILSYVAVGARSVEDQQHRLTVSGFDIPCGMKNPTSGTLSIMLNSCIAAQSSHTFMYRQWEVKTDGNPLAHTILRGAVNKHDQSMPNYHYEDLVLLNEMYQEARKNPKIIRYAGPQKPWFEPGMDMGMQFWECARGTSYYEIMLSRRSERYSKLGAKNAERKHKNIIAGGVQCILDHGIAYTIQYVPKRLAKKELNT